MLPEELPQVVLEMAREVGYEYFPKPSAGKPSTLGKGERELVPRIGIGTEIKWRDRPLGQQSVPEFKWRIKQYQGSFLCRVLSWVSVRCRAVWYGLQGGYQARP